MQALLLARVAEQGYGFSHRHAKSPKYGQCLATKGRTRLINAFDLRISSIDASCRSAMSLAAGEGLGRNVSHFSGKSSARFRRADAAEPCPLHRTKVLLPPCAWKQASDIATDSIYENCLDAIKIFMSTLRIARRDNSVELCDKQLSHASLRWNGSLLTAVTTSLIVLAAPGPTLRDFSFTFSNSARADQLGQLKQAAVLIERAGEGLSKVRFDGLQVLEKAVTVVTGSTFVDPQVINKEVDAIVHGEKNFQEELMNGINTTVQNFWSNVIDVLNILNPSALSRSAGTNISLFFETTAERLAAFEISALVSLGERWLILTPLLVLPMAWEMNRLQAKSEKGLREGQATYINLSDEAQRRGENVRRELERIELRTQILEGVSSLGKMATQLSQNKRKAGVIRSSINNMLKRLEELKPAEDPLLFDQDAESVISGEARTDESLSFLPTSPAIHGLWRLIYVSETSEHGVLQNFLLFPGVGLDNLCQQVWQADSTGVLAPDDGIQSPLLCLRTRNTGEFRLGPLGVFQVAVQGSLENLKSDQNALISFDTFSARPVEILGNKVGNEIPELNFLLPSSLQRNVEWTVVYLDSHLRVNQGSRGELFVFSKIE